MVVLKIDKNVPITKCSMDGEFVNTLRQMKVGDSFQCPDKSNRATGYISARRIGVKITTRKQPDGSIRIWRVK